jgi:hypothetical protein
VKNILEIRISVSSPEELQEIAEFLKEKRRKRDEEIALQDRLIDEANRTL